MLLTFLQANAIDRYVTLRTEESSGSSSKIDDRLQAIIESIFDRCIEEGEYRQVTGLLWVPYPALTVCDRQLALHWNLIVSTFWIVYMA
jgi:hypothetical protein